MCSRFAILSFLHLSLLLLFDIHRSDLYLNRYVIMTLELTVEYVYVHVLTTPIAITNCNFCRNSNTKKLIKILSIKYSRIQSIVLRQSRNFLSHAEALKAGMHCEYGRGITKNGERLLVDAAREKSS